MCRIRWRGLRPIVLVSTAWVRTNGFGSVTSVRPPRVLQMLRFDF